MRIVAGRHRGRALLAPKSATIRPTSDRLRETMFNVLAHAHGDPCRDGRVVDVFGGTGALGLEALSRGARFCLFVDEGVEARGLVRGNVEALGLGGVTKIWRRDATKPGTPTLDPFTVAFFDPPYGRGLATLAVEAFAREGWLAPDALLVVEEALDAPFAWPEAVDPLDERAVGDSVVRFGRWRPAG